MEFHAGRWQDLDRQEDGIFGFLLPEEMTRHYRRKFPRYDLDETSPVRIRFQTGNLRGISPLVRVVDLSEGGVGLRVHDAESIFGIGEMIEKMEMLLPEEEALPLAGMVRFACEERCGLQFIPNDAVAISRIVRHLHRLEEIENVSKKTYRSLAGAGKGAPAGGGKRRKILIVDDSLAVQEKCKQSFSSSFEVIQAFDGLEGVKKAVEQLPDLILMDVNMPKMNGLESTRIIRSQPHTRHIPICMFTAEGDRDAVVKALKFGVRDYIVKTADPRFVIERIQSMLISS